MVTRDRFVHQYAAERAFQSSIQLATNIEVYIGVEFKRDTLFTLPLHNATNEEKISSRAPVQIVPKTRSFIVQRYQNVLPSIPQSFVVNPFTCARSTRPGVYAKEGLKNVIPLFL